VQDRDVAPDELTDLTLERVRRRLIDVNQFFRWTPVGRSKFLRASGGANFSGPDFSAIVYPYTGATVAR